MSFSYIKGIPAGPHNPSQDQPGMQINTDSGSDIWDVDHIGFNANGGGQHNIIQFNQAGQPYVPTFPVSPPQLCTKIVASLPQLIYYSGTQSESEKQYMINASSFSTMLMVGITMKGGVFTAAMANNNVVTYSALASPLEPFNNSTFAVFLQGIDIAGSAGSTIVTAVSQTTFTVSGVVTGKNYYFLAIGH